MPRKLFCQLSPAAYRISVWKCCTIRRLENIWSRKRLARKRSADPLPVSIYKHNSLIRRRLGNVDMALQENKAVNLSLAVPHLDGILIQPGETFSFWYLVGSVAERKGYREGLTIQSQTPAHGIGGGLCQLTNLIHWMVLHTPLTIVEHHHHDGIDLFPDFNRQIPFGTGTSIFYNYLDYRFRNDTDITYQLLVHTTPTYLCGEIRASRRQPFVYHIKLENEFFSREDGIVYRNGDVFRETIDPVTGNRLKRELIRKNHARVTYDTSGLTISDVSR